MLWDRRLGLYRYNSEHFSAAYVRVSNRTERCWEASADGLWGRFASLHWGLVI